ncbi:MAG: glycosyltransferase family 4 protein [Fimbriimonadaceae bacterium]
MHPLCVLTKVVGGVSETFIEDHAKRLLPGRTALAAAVALPESGRAWWFDGPLLVLRDRRRWVRVLVHALTLSRSVGLTERRHLGRLEAFWRAQGCSHVLSEYLDVGPAYVRRAKDMGLHWYSFGHGYDVSRSLRSAFWRRLFREHRFADGVFVRSSTARRRLSDLGIARDRIHVTPGGVAVPHEPPERRPEGGPVRLLTVGRLVGKKDILTTIRALRTARAQADREIVLTVVGDGPDAARAKALASNQGLQGAVRFLGSLPREQVQDELRAADAFVLHSRTDPRTGDEEGLPTAILEAMAYALPVVSTRHAGIPDAVVEGETGFLTDEGDVQETARAIATLADDAELRRRMGLAGYERARAEYTWERERERILTAMGLPVLDG